MSDQVFTALKGGIRTTDGIQIVRRGDPIPSNLAEGERDRLKRLRVIGKPEDAAVEQLASTEPPATPFDIRAADDAALVEHLRTGNDGKALVVDATVSLAAGDRDLARRVLAAEAEVNGGEPRATVKKALDSIIEAE